MKIPAAQFKAECLKLMDQVAKRHTEIIITKRGRPVARLVPVSPESPKSKSGVWGWMKDSVEVLGDIVSPMDESWSADE